MSVCMNYEAMKELIPTLIMSFLNHSREVTESVLQD